VLTPAGQRRDLAGATTGTTGTSGTAGTGGTSALELTEQGFYEIRGAGRDAGPVIVAASNVSLAESNLERMDPKELVLAVTGGDATGSTSGRDVLPDEAQELAQRIWWYLLFAGILLLIAETAFAHKYSRATR
jgi:hypothetical protein